jgi:preprotein translocase subunit SecE
MTTPAEFVRQVKQEVSKITWPSRADAFRGTMVVIVLAMMMMLF